MGLRAVLCLVWWGLSARKSLGQNFLLDPNLTARIARAMVGERPTLRIEGDAAFANDLNWLIENLRWDVQEDLSRLVGDAPAREIARFGNALANAARSARGRDAFTASGAGQARHSAAEGVTFTVVPTL